MGRRSVPPAMRFARFRGDLGLLRDGAKVAYEFGLPTLTGLVAVADLLAHDVYEPHSLRRTEDGLRFTLRNPPLRMGAFYRLRVAVGGQPVPPEDASVWPGGAAAEVPFSGIDREHPIGLPVGVRSEFRLRLAPVPAGRLCVRLELHSVAIPPVVWFELVDEPRAAEVPR